MDTYLYNCHYCGIEYQPKRRHIQRFCCNSCRVSSFNQKRKIGLSEPQMNNLIKKEPVKIEKMSWAGVGNAAVGSIAGTVAVNVVTNLLTDEGNKPATKNDLKNLISNLNQRYHSIKNLPNKSDGKKPFYDLITQTIIYLFTKN